MLLAQTDGLAGEAYNVADDAPLTAYEMAVTEGHPTRSPAARRS